jgi:uncharacterized protein (TIGR03435 family)
MKSLMLFLTACFVLVGGALHGQDIVGKWQGTLNAGKDLRLIVDISKDGGGALTGNMYSIDQTPRPFKMSSVSVDGGTFKFSVDLIGGTYEGKFSPDGNTITGTWTQGPNPLPLVLVRATKTNAWEIPAPPPPPKLMPANADPSFAVATIKPNDTGATSMQALIIDGRAFKTRASSLEDLIAFSYNVESKQIINGPAWISSDRYDIEAVPDVEGEPNPEQVRSMIRKLLADRFQLKIHKDTREMSAFVLEAEKSGAKIAHTQSNGALPGLFLHPGKGGTTLSVMNATMPDFTGFLQSAVLDRPVVDHTGLEGKYDFNVTFLPDETQFNGHAPFAKPAETVENAPPLFEAVRQQLGLKLTSEKTAVDVIVIDHVEKPSPN